MSEPILNVRNLHATVDGMEILKGVDLAVYPGEVHAIMGPNGSGKSTLAQVLAGHPAFTITEGSTIYKGLDLVDLEPEQRAREGLFLAFQYPVEIPGVPNSTFLRAGVNEVRKHRGLAILDAFDFEDLVRERAKIVQLDRSLIDRPVNEGFSGGEKKRNEIFQMAMLEPDLGILDETDSGLDIDALRIVAAGVNQLRNGNRAFILVTHYQRLLEYIVPDHVHVLYNGRIVKSGDKELALQLEEQGYDWIKEEVDGPTPQPVNPAELFNQALAGS